MPSSKRLRSWPAAAASGLFLLALLGLSVPRAHAQEEAFEPIPEHAFVRVQTNLPESAVYVDSVYAGTAAAGYLRVRPGTRRIALRPPEADAWHASTVSAELAVQAGDSAEVRLFFPHLYRVETVPYGATVVLEQHGRRETLGLTPLLHRRDAALSGEFVVEKEGFLPQRLAPGDAVWNRHFVELKPEATGRMMATEVTWRRPTARHRWIDYAAGGLAVAAGFVAVHYKFKADRLYDRYSDTGDPDLRPLIRANDIRSGVALAGMQVGVGVLAIRFALR